MPLGERLPLLDAGQRVRGGVPYVLNAEVPGMLTSVLVRSTQPHALLRTVDVSQAEEVDGVVAILSRADLTAPGLSPYFGPLTRDQPILAIDRVRYVGEPIVAIAAVDADAAREAASLVRVDYQRLPAVLDMDAAANPAAAALHGTSNRFGEYVIQHGDVPRRSSTQTSWLRARIPAPRSSTCRWSPIAWWVRWEGSDRVVVETSTSDAARCPPPARGNLGLPTGHVRVVVPTLGGAFGSKCYTELAPALALLARKARRPVKLVLTRAEEFVTTQRQAARTSIRSAATREGRIVALQATCELDNGAYYETADRVIRHAARTLSAAYRIPNLDIRAWGYYTNNVPCGPFRAPGSAQAIWAIESHLDELALRLGRRSR